MVAAVLAFVTGGCDRTQPPYDNGWDRSRQGSGTPVPEAVLEELEEHDRNVGKIDQLEPEFQKKLSTLLGRLREQGWAARVSFGPRTVDEQMDLFEKRRTTLLRGSHLCNRAADLSLYPVGIPPVDHEFWDIKDREAVALGLDVVDYEPGSMKFVDRPHVQSTRCHTADWDRLGLSPVGTYAGELDGRDLRLEFRRVDGDLNLRAWLDDKPAAVTGLKRERGDGEQKIRRDEVEFDLAGQTVSGEFSTLRNESGVVRPDYRSLDLELDGAAVELERSD